MGRENRIERTQHGSVVALTVWGEHDAASRPSLRSHIEPVARPGASILVDFTATTFIDSTVLASLIYAAENADHITLVASPGSHCRRILELAGIAALSSVSWAEADPGLLLRLRAQAARRHARNLGQASADLTGRSLDAITTVLDGRWTPDRAERVRRASLLIGRSPAIEQAKTLLATQHAIIRTEAFQLLVHLSQRQNVKLHVVADKLVAKHTTGSEHPRSVA
jgi:anti-anti-sigma factor